MRARGRPDQTRGSAVHGPAAQAPPSGGLCAQPATCWAHHSMRCGAGSEGGYRNGLIGRPARHTVALVGASGCTPGQLEACGSTHPPPQGMQLQTPHHVGQTGQAQVATLALVGGVPTLDSERSSSPRPKGAPTQLLKRERHRPAGFFGRRKGGKSWPRPRHLRAGHMHLAVVADGRPRQL